MEFVNYTDNIIPCICRSDQNQAISHRCFLQHRFSFNDIKTNVPKCYLLVTLITEKQLQITNSLIRFSEGEKKLAISLTNMWKITCSSKDTKGYGKR